MLDPLMCFTRMSSRCLWDADTDNYAEDVFMNVGDFVLFIQMLGGETDSSIQYFNQCVFNVFCLCVQDSLFCVVAVFGSYYY